MKGGVGTWKVTITREESVQEPFRAQDLRSEEDLAPTSALWIWEEQQLLPGTVLEAARLGYLEMW